MNTKLTIRSIFAAAVFGCGAAAYPLSLGPVAGSTVVGRPLELSAPVQFDDLAQGNGSGCVTAELTYGDRSIDSAMVHVNLSPDGQVARISSPAVVDEPVVTVLLRAGCGRQSTRRYVLLAEAPRDEPILLGAASSLALAPNASSPLLAAGDALGRSATPSASAQGRVAAARPPHGSAIVRRVAANATNELVPSAGRLQLAVWEPGSEGSPWLRASTELRSIPSADAAHRAAATALWRALNAQPQDL
ncbi:MAG: hypothetical protein JWQ33_2122, partial [Ramlibacter sp.]|nr:hypothetical protein [Ramlibacter sp.]